MGEDEAGCEYETTCNDIEEFTKIILHEFCFFYSNKVQVNGPDEFYSSIISAFGRLGLDFGLNLLCLLWEA